MHVQIPAHSTLGTDWPAICQVYYVYGFMLLVFLILVVVTVCVTVVATYFLLNAENYRWQWTSFASAASASLYALACSFILSGNTVPHLRRQGASCTCGEYTCCKTAGVMSGDALRKLCPCHAACFVLGRPTSTMLQHCMPGSCMQLLTCHASLAGPSFIRLTSQILQLT